jgi:guanylate kinase
MSSPKLFVVAGPSGCGKTTIAGEILRRHPEITFSVSATTRPKRQGEIDGKDYYFTTKKDFEAKIKRGDLIEWENIYGEYYGTLKSEVDRAAKNGHPILFDVDVKGALSIKSKYNDRAVIIFIKPPSIEVLLDRLRKRRTETPEELTRRSERFKMELERSKDFDHCVVNDVLETAVTDVDDIISKYI